MLAQSAQLNGKLKGFRVGYVLTHVTRSGSPFSQRNSKPSEHQRRLLLATATLPSSSRLVAHLPNGVSLELECIGEDVALVTAMIAALRER